MTASAYGIGDSVDVLIVGAGPIGLALAVELGSRGVRTINVEQNERIGRQPRAKTTNVRTMEHFRRWGLAEKVLKASPLPRDYGNDVVFATRMYGHQIVNIENASYLRPDRDERYSQGGQWIPQYLIEEILREKVLSFPECQLRFKTKFVDAVDCDDHVEITLEDLTTGTPHSVLAKYMVGADGGGSSVRDLLGFEMEGERSFGAFLNLVLKIPELADAHPLPSAIMYWITNAESAPFMGPLDTDDVWYWGIQLEDDTIPDDEEIRHLVTRSIGKEFKFEVLHKDPWFAHSLMSNGYAKGRIFLAGDACHLHPPFGGFGMNMGVGDAVDLGWKLAAMIDGWGSQHLLASYELERRPVHRLLIDVAVQNTSVLTQHLVQPDLEDETELGVAARQKAAGAVMERKLQEFKALGVILGYHYSGSPILISDGTAPPPRGVVNYTPSAHPGCRAPHCWLEDGTSLFDRFGQGFTLLVTDLFSESEITPLLKAAGKHALPINVLAPKDGRLKDLYKTKFALIRPDQHVAWRGDEIGDDAQFIVDTIRGANAQAETTTGQR